MKEEVNLLTIDSKKPKKMSLLFSMSLLTLLISILLAALPLFYLLILKTNLSSVADLQKRVISDMKPYDGERVKLLTISERLSVIRKITGTDRTFSQRLGQIAESIPPGAETDTLELSGGKAAFRISSTSLFAFNTFFNTTLATLPAQKKAGVKKVTIVSFSVDSGRYDALIDVTYNTPVSE